MISLLYHLLTSVYITYKHVFPEVLFEITLSALSWNELPKGHIFPLLSSGVARAFQGGRLANHPPERPKWGQNLEYLRGNERNYRNMRKEWGNVLILPTREWEAGYSLASFLMLIDLMNTGLRFHKQWNWGYPATTGRGCNMLRAAESAGAQERHY